MINSKKQQQQHYPYHKRREYRVKRTPVKMEIELWHTKFKLSELQGLIAYLIIQQLSVKQLVICSFSLSSYFCLIVFIFER